MRELSPLATICGRRSANYASHSSLGRQAAPSPPPSPMADIRGPSDSMLSSSDLHRLVSTAELHRLMESCNSGAMVPAMDRSRSWLNSAGSHSIQARATSCLRANTASHRISAPSHPTPLVAPEGVLSCTTVPLHAGASEQHGSVQHAERGGESVVPAECAEAGMS